MDTKLYTIKRTIVNDSVRSESTRHVFQIVFFFIFVRKRNGDSSKSHVAVNVCDQKPNKPIHIYGEREYVHSRENPLAFFFRSLSSHALSGKDGFSERWRSVELFVDLISRTRGHDES